MFRAVAARGWLPAYVGVVVLWGSVFAFVKLALVSFTPVGVSLGRMILASVTLLAICLATRTALPPRRLWGHLAVAALLASVLSWTLMTWAQTHIPSALAAIIGSSVPLMTLLVVLVFFREQRPTRERILGLIVGFAGIFIVVGIWHGLPASQWIGIAAAASGAFALAASIPYTRRYLTGGRAGTAVSPLSLASGMFILATVETAPLGLAFPLVHSTVTASAVLCLVALGCLSSGIAFVLNYRVIQLTDSTTASTVMYLTPLVAVAISTLVLHEQLTWNEPVGGAVILLGAAVAQGLVRLPTRHASPSAPTP